jgi:hypothetical protein
MKSLVYIALHLWMASDLAIIIGKNLHKLSLKSESSNMKKLKNNR